MQFVLRKSLYKKPIVDRFFVGLLLFGSVANVHAAQREITMSMAIQRSLQAHPELRAFDSRRAIVDGRVRQAGLGSRPTLELQFEDGLGSGQYEAADSLQTTLSISWALERDLLAARQQNARQDETLLDIERRKRRLDVAAEAGRRFLALLALQEQRGLALQAESMAKRTVQALKQRQVAGKITAVDTLRARALQARYALAVEDLDHEIRSQQRSLAAMWRRPQEPVSAIGNMSLPADQLNFELLSAGLRANPNIEFFLTKERLNQAETALAKLEARSRWRLSAGVRRHEAADDFALVAGVSIPLGGSGRAAGRVAELQAEAELSAATADAVRLDLETRLYVLVQEYDHARHVAEAMQSTIIPLLVRALEEARRAYEVGRHSYQDWAAVQTEWLTAKEDLLASQLAAHQALLEVERLTGTGLLNTKEIP